MRWERAERAMGTMRARFGGVTATVFPRREPGRDEQVPLTAWQRRRAARRFGSDVADAPLWSEIDGRSKRKHDAYEALSLRSARAEAGADRGPGVGGEVRELTALGGDTVWLAQGEDGLERLRDSIGKDYFVTPDATLRAPDKLSLLASHELDASEERNAPDPFEKRYEESGIVLAPERARGRGVVCGILDSGVDSDHLDFRHRHRKSNLSIPFGFVLSDNKIQAPAEGRGFDLFGHGTHVASIIGGKRGVAPSCKLIVAGTPRTRLTSSVVMLNSGLNWLFEKMADDGDWGYPLILNLSLGFPERGEPDAPADPAYEEAFKAFHALLDVVIAQDILVVSAIGNSAARHVSPGSRPDVLSVGAVDGNLKRAPWSSHVLETLRPALTGPRVMGYGAKVVAAERRRANGDNLWVTRSGTSQAAAYVSGIAALYWSETPDLPALDIARLIEDKAYPVKGGEARCGKGLARYTRRSEAT